MLKDGFYLVGELVSSGPSRYRAGERAGTPIPNGPAELVVRRERPGGDTQREWVKYWPTAIEGEASPVAKALTDIDGELRDNGDTHYPRGTHVILQVGVETRAWIAPTGGAAAAKEITAYDLKSVDEPAPVASKK